MPDEIYDVAAQAARYWFLFLMALIVWRSYRWLVRDRKQRRKRLKLLPDAGFVGELVVVQGNNELPIGIALPVSQEGVLGCLRGDDVYVPVKGVRKKHLWFEFDEDDGLYVQAFGKNAIEVDGQLLTGRRQHAYLTHGSWLTVGEAGLRLRMFAGFEYAGVKHAPAAEFEQPGESPAQPPEQPQAGMVAFTPEQLAAFQQMQWMAAWQAAQGQANPLAATPGMPLTPAQLALLAQQGAMPQTLAPQGAAPLAPTAPDGAAPMLTTAQGAFLAPPKVAVGGPILPAGDVLPQEDHAPQPPAPLDEQPQHEAKRYRGNPLPPIAPQEFDLSDAPSAPVADASADAASSAQTDGRARRTDSQALQATETAAAEAALWNTARTARPDAVLYPPLYEGFDVGGEAQQPAANPTFAPRVTFYAPVVEELPPDYAPFVNGQPVPGEAAEDWPYAQYPHEVMPFDENGGAGDEPYEYADEDEAPRSLYVEPDEAEKAKRLLWDKFLKGGGRP